MTPIPYRVERVRPRRRWRGRRRPLRCVYRRIRRRGCPPRWWRRWRFALVGRHNVRPVGEPRHRRTFPEGPVPHPWLASAYALDTTVIWTLPSHDDRSLVNQRYSHYLRSAFSSVYAVGAQRIPSRTARLPGLSSVRRARVALMSRSGRSTAPGGRSSRRDSGRSPRTLSADVPRPRSSRTARARTPRRRRA
jgi:hypothetical protein